MTETRTFTVTETCRYEVTLSAEEYAAMLADCEDPDELLEGDGPVGMAVADLLRPMDEDERVSFVCVTREVEEA